MISTMKKTIGALFVVPVLVLSVGVFGAAPAYAATECQTSSVGGVTTYKTSPAPTNCVQYNKPGDSNSGVLYSFNAAGEKTSCNEKLGIGGAVNPGCAKGEGQQTELFGSNGVVTLIINILLFIIGILCVIMIVFGGIRYTTSTGDKNRVDGAKNTIIYAVVGLVVAIVAYALVNWVFGAIGGS